MHRRTARLASLVTLFVAALVASAPAASAQQLIDASEDGDKAFIGFAIMCFLFVGFLFAIDKVRNKD